MRLFEHADFGQPRHRRAPYRSICSSHADSGLSLRTPPSGAFSHIDQEFDPDSDRPQLVGVRGNGKTIGIEGMSDGQRDQLTLRSGYGAARVRQAVEEALEMGCSNLGAIRYLLNVNLEEVLALMIHTSMWPSLSSPLTSASSFALAPFRCRSWEKSNRLSLPGFSKDRPLDSETEIVACGHLSCRACTGAVAPGPSILHSEWN